MTENKIKVGIFGASGYAGYELAKILIRHPYAAISFTTSYSQSGKTLAELFPGGPDLPLIDPEEAPLVDVDLAFLCLPHGAAAPTALTALDAGARVIDLSADFRLKDAAVYEEWYGLKHPAPELLSTAVYGLTEFSRQALPAARLVANPGCYPTSVLLPLNPLLSAGALAAGPIIVDSKSGVSGAGRSPKAHTQFVEVADNLSPYNIGRKHRHLPEIEQGLAVNGDMGPPVIFSPHLLPVPRGILSTIYMPLADSWNDERVRTTLEETYQEEQFVQVLAPGSQATLAHVNNTNNCVLGITVAGETAILTSAIDNLVKGAAGQAVQNMNVMFDFPESTGLDF